jgi:hypothetical protein
MACKGKITKYVQTPGVSSNLFEWECGSCGCVAGKHVSFPNGAKVARPMCPNCGNVNEVNR